MLGEAPSTEALTAIGDEGVLALVCDSTNVFQDTPSGSEESVHEGLLDAGRRRPTGRVLVTTFASNAARLQTIGRVAIETGRQVCVAGRSLDRILRVAQATGYLKDFPPPIRFDEAMRLPRERGADHRHRRAGRAARGARPDRVRQRTSSSSARATR